MKKEDEKAFLKAVKKDPYLTLDQFKRKQAEEKKNLAREQRWENYQTSINQLCQKLEGATILSATKTSTGYDGDYEDYTPPEITIVTDKATFTAKDPEEKSV